MMEQTLKTCYKCGTEGHLAYTCPENSASHGGSHFAGMGANPTTKKCYKCSGVGHIARECRKEDSVLQLQGDGTHQPRVPTSKKVS
ncbi:hypothetical protein C8J57DRAFT_183718 [Mycena rebaudengoi]|nr:hypothetical protein C8J57DRAFT_183718 [Mycena rebaudengoi]